MEQSAFHVHSHLDIIINGVYFLVPSQVGIPGNCFYWLHTHDASGTIHIESPKSEDFTLTQFVDIWKTTGDFPISGAIPKIFVNGQLANSTLDDTKINKHDEIALVYGTMPSAISSFYQFNPGE
jgi:hypothetical protein